MEYKNRLQNIGEALLNLAYPEEILRNRSSDMHVAGDPQEKKETSQQHVDDGPNLTCCLCC